MTNIDRSVNIQLTTKQQFPKGNLKYIENERIGGTIQWDQSTIELNIRVVILSQSANTYIEHLPHHLHR